MAKFTPLTKEGETFIKTICSGLGTTLLQGKSSFRITDPKNKYYNPNGVLPFCIPTTSPTKKWIANAFYNGKPIQTNQDLGEALIDWYNKYGSLYLMDANVMAAQAYAESGYKIWNYPLTSTASGISQFVAEAMYDVIITNKYSEFCPPNTNMTTAEINALIKNIHGLENKTLAEINATINNFNTYSVATTLGKQNRPIIHQNIIDNPEIMIKAQFRFMKYIANAKSQLTSNALFGYSRGPGNVEIIYSNSINNTRKDNGDDYVKEGVEYVFKIFSILGDKDNLTGSNNKPKGIYFGYDKGTNNLGMNMPPSLQKDIFDPFNANTAESNIKYSKGNIVSVNPNL